MYEYTPESIRRTALFYSWHEACELWHRIVRAMPEPHTLVLMPDGLHMLHDTFAPRRLVAAMAGYARWRNHHRGERGQVWDPLEPPIRVKDPFHARRKHRYHHLNPCRDKLVTDPLGWPFSTYADAIGWTLAPVRPKEPDQRGYIEWARRDDTVDLSRPACPEAPNTPPSFEAILGAVSWLGRRAPEHVPTTSDLRSALVTAGLAAGYAPSDAADFIGRGRSTVSRTPRAAPDVVQRVLATAADSRFTALDDMDRRPSWGRYRWKR